MNRKIPRSGERSILEVAGFSRRCGETREIVSFTASSSAKLA